MPAAGWGCASKSGREFASTGFSGGTAADRAPRVNFRFLIALFSLKKRKYSPIVRLLT